MDDTRRSRSRRSTGSDSRRTSQRASRSSNRSRQTRDRRDRSTRQDAGRERVQRPEARQPRARRTSGRQPQRILSLDGLRAFAIVSVLLYHLDVTWLPSGHIGVVVFLVLSGYLITCSLVRKVSSGEFSMGSFLAGRLRRLWPSLAVMILVACALCVGFNRVLLTKMRPDILPGLLMFENMSYILRGVSYFDQIGGPSPLTHLWYLGVDIQFCLIWPLLLTVLMAISPNRATTRRLCLVLAIVSAVEMALLFRPEGDTTRIYYALDTRAFAPLVGAWLALALPLGRPPARDVRRLLGSRTAGIILDVLALGSLVGLVILMVIFRDTAPTLFRGGLFGSALLTAVLIAALVRPRSLMGGLFSLPPLVWLGQRSYCIYLWHFPLIQLFAATSNTTPWWMIALCLIATAVASELTYQLVERPISDGSFGAMLESFSPAKMANGSFGSFLRSGTGIACILGLALLITDAVGLVVLPSESLVPEEAIRSTGDDVGHAKDVPEALREGGSGDGGASTYTEEELDNLPSGSIVLRAPKSEASRGVFDPVLIGDSVPGDAEAYWVASCPDGLLDSYVGRRPDQAVDVLDEYLAKGVVGNVVILQAFSNMPATDEQIEHMIQACGEDRDIYLVNVRILASEQDQINDSIARAVERHENVHLIDWHALSEGNTDTWLYSDGEHLTPEGQPIYINMISNAIERDFARRGGTIRVQSDAAVDDAYSTIDTESDSETSTTTDDATDADSSDSDSDTSDSSDESGDSSTESTEETDGESDSDSSNDDSYSDDTTYIEDE